MPFLDADARTPAKTQVGRLLRTRSQLLIAARLLVLGHVQVAIYMAEHADASLRDYINKEKTK